MLMMLTVPYPYAQITLRSGASGASGALEKRELNCAEGENIVSIVRVITRHSGILRFDSV